MRIGNLKSLSASKVDTYFGCKRLFKYKYVNPPFVPPQSKYLIMGSTVHQVLEFFHKNIEKTDKYKKLMSQCFKKAYTNYNIDDCLINEILSKEDCKSMKTMLSAYLEHIDGVPESLFIEKLFKFTIQNEFIFGKADRVDKLEDGSIKIVDYKTGKPLTKKQMEESVQIPTYGLWLRKEFGEDVPVYGEYVYLKHLGTKKGIKTFEITDDIIADVIEKYTRVLFELKHNTKFTRNPDYKYCYCCDFKEYCMNDNEN